MGKSDLDDFLVLLTRPADEGGYELDPTGGGMYNYCRVLRLFFEWLNDRDEYGAYLFWEDIEIPSQEVRAKDPDMLLTPGDVEDLKQAAGRGRNTQRDRALITFLADGPRVTLTSQLRVGDVQVEGPDAHWKPNSEAVGGHKGLDDRKRPLLWSMGELKTWINFGHPDPENPRAPLWTTQGYDPERPQEGALSPDGIRSVLERTAERADIDKPVNPHAFRHAAMTRLSNEGGLNPQQIQHVAGWSDDRMLAIYDQTTDDQRNDGIRTQLGIPTAGEDDGPDMEPVPCSNCRELLQPSERFCPKCGEPKDPGVRLAKSRMTEDVSAGLINEADDPERTQLRARLQQELGKDEVVNLLMDRLLDE